MINSLSRRRFVVATSATGLTLAASPRLLADDPLRVGYVYVGPIGDYGWTYRHDLARLAVEEHFGDRVQTSYVENVAEGPDAERVIRQLAAGGHGLVFTTSFGFMEPTIRVAEQFPDVKFEHATGYRSADNVAVYNARFYEGRAVIGTIAGHVSQSELVGYIASFPIPEVVMGINSFALAAQKVNPDVRVQVVWVNTWYDPGREADAARTLIDQGADIIVQHTDSPAPLQVAEERGVHGFGQASDMRAYAPNAQLTSIVNNWADYYIDRIQAALDGTWETHIIWHGIRDGMIQMAPYGPGVTDEAAAAADAVFAGIEAGELHPFEGPVRDQDGEVRIPEGRHATDEELLGMDWWVEGVSA